MDSRSAKAFIESVNTLRDLGLSDLDLPRVALVGMRDAKANVLEAILGFATDNSRHGCPFEYRLSRGGSPWSCRISVRSISEDNVPLQAPSTRFIGDVITKKTELPAMMKRAQIAALNPSISTANILSMSPNEMDNYPTTHLSTTCVHSTVSLELNGTDLTDLTLIEMPDLDLSFEHETRTLVENLVLNQLQGKCIIVAAVPMNADIFSKRALHLARNVDPDGARTIGVLTNLTEERTPDHPDFALQLGYYYITLHNDGAKLGGKKKAVEKPIAKVLVSSSSSHEQDSTERLEATLSFLLTELIRKTLPLLRVDLIHCLDQCRQEFASLPPTVTEPATYMLVMLTRLSDDVRQITRGSSEPSPLLEQMHEFYADLKLAIRRTAPSFVPVLRSSPVTQDIISHLADDEGPCERAGLVSPFYLDDMRKHIKAYATRDLLSHFPCQAKKALIESFQNQWASLVSECLERVVGSMVKLVIERIHVVCQGHELLTGHLRSLLGELIWHHLNICSEYLEAILEIELTQQLYLNSCSEHWLSRYRDIRKGRIGANQKSRNSTLASKNTTFTPSHQAQNVQSEATLPATKLNEPLPFKSRSSDAQATPPQQGAENSAKNPTGQPSSAQKADPKDKPNAGLESSKASTTDSKAAEAPKARPSSGLFGTARPSEAPNATTSGGLFSFAKSPEAPKAPVNPAALGSTRPSGASNTTATSLFPFAASSSSILTSPTKSTPPPSESKSVFAALKATPVPKDSTSNTTPTASFASVFSTTSAFPPLTSKEGPAQKDLPFPIKPTSPESEKLAKAKITDELFKDSNPKVFPFSIPRQPSTTGSTASNVDPSCTSKDPDVDYRIALSALSRLGFTGLTRADLDKLGMMDEYEDELKLMADVRGYFQIASMRVADYVPAFIGLKFVRAVSSDILPFFMEKMALGRPTANTICTTYFAEDAEMAVKREGLSNIQMRLESAQLELYKLGVY